MKSSFFFLLFVLLTESQLHAQNWEAKIIVQHPFTYEQDTAWIGFDVNADDGYQDGYDILDSNFYGKSIAIRGYDPLIAKHPGYCVNLKRNIIKPTEKGTMDFILFVHCDTFSNKTFPFDTINRVWMIWDTTDFLHSPAQYEVISVVAYGGGGYFHVMDGEEQWLFHKPLNNIPIAVFGNKVLLLLFSADQCQMSPNSMMIVVRVWINQGVYINKPEQREELRVYPNPVQDNLIFAFPESTTQSVHWSIYDYTGKELIRSVEIENKEHFKINTTELESGYYILKVNHGGQFFSKPFVKN